MLEKKKKKELQYLMRKYNLFKIHQSKTFQQIRNKNKIKFKNKIILLFFFQ